jgi:hypothetical protein
VLEVVAPPQLKRLYFWALQASFASESQIRGGAHLGLQWNRHYPGGTAANWGGYAAGGKVLRGSESVLPSARSNANTRDYPWVAGHRYRLRISRAGEAPGDAVAWLGTITHLESGVETPIRELYTTGEYLIRPVVWSEVFARCEHPTVAVRWSGLGAVTARGKKARPSHVRVNYQSHADGGCDNTTVSVDELGVLQITNAERRVPQAAVLPLPGALER